MSKLFSKTELKHLKYKMINERGMTALEAGKEIEELIKENKKNYELARQSEKANQNAQEHFKEGFKQITTRKHERKT